MRSLFILILSLGGLCLSARADGSLHLGDITGWKYQDATTSEFMREFSGGANGMLSETDSKDPSPPTVLVFEVPAKYLSKDMDSVESWRRATFRGKVPKKTMISDHIYKKNGQTQYYAEVSADIGRANMMPSIVLGKKIDEKYYVFYYENRRAIYLRNVDAVKKLFHQL